MRKKRAIRNFAGIIFLCLVVLIFTVISFPIPDSDYTFMGFARGITTGIEYKGGTVITYNVNSTSTENQNVGEGLASTALSLEQRLSEYNYSANVFKTSDSSITVQVELNGIDDECKNVADILNLDNQLAVKIANSDEVYLTGHDFKNVSAMKNEGNYGVYIEFTKDGQEKFENLTKTASEDGETSGTIEFYIGVSETPFTKLTIEETYTESAIFISGSMSSLEEAELMAARLNSTKYQYTYTENSKVTITKEQANANLIKTAIITCVVFIAISLFLFARYKNLGLCGVLAMFIALLAQILLMLSLPGVILTPTSFIASMLTMALGGVICSLLFEAMRNEYKLGKKIHASVKFGFTKTYAYVIDALAVFAGIMLLVLLFATEMIKQFAIASLIGLVVYGLSCLLLTYLFSKFYVDINPSKAKKYGFKREAHVNELE